MNTDQTNKVQTIFHVAACIFTKNQRTTWPFCLNHGSSVAIVSWKSSKERNGHLGCCRRTSHAHLTYDPLFDLWLWKKTFCLLFKKKIALTPYAIQYNTPPYKPVIRFNIRPTNISTLFSHILVNRDHFHQRCVGRKLKLRHANFNSSLTKTIHCIWLNHTINFRKSWYSNSMSPIVPAACPPVNAKWWLAYHRPAIAPDRQSKLSLTVLTEAVLRSITSSLKLLWYVIFF